MIIIIIIKIIIIMIILMIMKMVMTMIMIIIIINKYSNKESFKTLCCYLKIAKWIWENHETLRICIWGEFSGLKNSLKRSRTGVTREMRSTVFICR